MTAGDCFSEFGKTLYNYKNTIVPVVRGSDFQVLILNLFFELSIDFFLRWNRTSPRLLQICYVLRFCKILTDLLTSAFSITWPCVPIFLPRAEPNKTLMPDRSFEQYFFLVHLRHHHHARALVQRPLTHRVLDTQYPVGAHQ